MGNLKSPQTQRNSERDVAKGQDRFLGMLNGIPATEIPEGYAHLVRNMIDYGEHSEGRPGTSLVHATTMDEQMHARVEVQQLSLFIVHRGTTVEAGSLETGVFTEVINRTGVTLAESTGEMAVVGKDVIFANENGVFRIVLDNPDYYYMIRINSSNPVDIPVDIPETTLLQYGYRYLYSTALLDGVGVRNRTVAEVEIVREGGTCFDIENDKDYGERFYATPIGEDLDETHLAGPFVVPDGVQDVTHMPIYRTENIGEASGGVNAAAIGQGNQLDYMVWVNDIAVAKAFSVVKAAAIVDASVGTFERGDVGETLYDTAGNSDTIATFVDSARVLVTGAGTLPNGAIDVALGQGRVFSMVQVGTAITRLGGAAFVAADVGRTIFWADGSYSIPISVNTGAGTAVAAWSEGHGNQAATMMPVAGNFVRMYNDTTLDSGGGAGRISLEDRIASGSDVYIPRRYFQPVPNGQVTWFSSGYIFFGIRDDTKYRYSQVGDKMYTAGMYRPVEQEGELDAELRGFRGLPGMMVILLNGRMKIVPTSSSVNVGRQEVGETVSHLPEAYSADDHVGVYFWQSIQYIGVGSFLAVTTEPAVRLFADGRWSQQNYAIDQATGLDAISKNYLKQMYPPLGCVSQYTEEDGYLLWFYRWRDTDSDDIILDTGGTALAGDDVINDTGDNVLAGDDIWNDTGGVLDGS